MKREPIAIKLMNNLCATVVYDIKYGIEDRILVGDVLGDKRYPARWCKVRYDNPTGAYFLHFRKKEYLFEYMKTEQKVGDMIDQSTL